MHAGTKLTPPVGDDKRVRELGPLMPTDLSVSGTSFRESGTDVAIAGLGWVGVAVDGTADLRCGGAGAPNPRRRPPSRGRGGGVLHQ